MRLLKTVSIIAFGAAACAAAVPAQAESGVYVGASLGAAKTDIDSNSLDKSLLDLGVSGLSSSTDESDTGYKLRVGYQFNDYFAIEGGYVNLGRFKYDARFAQPVAGTMNAKIKAEGFDVAAVGSLPVGAGFSLLGKAGVLFSKTKLTATASAGAASATESADESEANFLAGLGVQYAINRNFSVRVEWERYFQVGKDETTGEGDVDLYSVGLNYRF